MCVSVCVCVCVWLYESCWSNNNKDNDSWVLVDMPGLASDMASGSQTLTANAINSSSSSCPAPPRSALGPFLRSTSTRPVSVRKPLRCLLQISLSHWPTQTRPEQTSPKQTSPVRPNPTRIELCCLLCSYNFHLHLHELAAWLGLALASWQSVSGSVSISAHSRHGLLSPIWLSLLNCYHIVGTN